MEKIAELFKEILARGILKKAVFSKPSDKSLVKLVVTRFEKSGEELLSYEYFTSDNKATRKNFTPNSTELAKLSESFGQVNLLTSAGDIEIKRSKSGSVHIGGRLKADAEAVKAASHNSEKRYIIDPSRDVGFLIELGLADKNGRIHDKKQAKFRQINRFLELVRDVEDSLPTDRPAVICDLCCGKSYLTFAVYYYFTAIKKREVRMYGIDLKADVIAYCTEVAERQGFEHLRFISGNINEYDPPEAPDMVISLHACDIATDIVLYNAIRWRARLILSTPCCHHEMSKQLALPAENADLREEFDFILSHPLLKQKLCDSLTDALRVKRLESRGYSVSTVELIDPDETPKNVMLRAVRNDRMSDSAKKKAYDEYKSLTRRLGVSPYLDNLLENEAAR